MRACLRACVRVCVRLRACALACAWVGVLVRARELTQRNPTQRTQPSATQTPHRTPPATAPTQVFTAVLMHYTRDQLPFTLCADSKVPADMWGRSNGAAGSVRACMCWGWQDVGQEQRCGWQCVCMHVCYGKGGGRMWGKSNGA